MFHPWIIIGGVALLIACGSALIRPRDVYWAARLDRPSWLFFEPAIPFIWTVIYTCGAVSATRIWTQEPGSLNTWFLMGLYLLVEIVTTLYIPATLHTHSLEVGTTLGVVGLFLGGILALTVWPLDHQAALLLLPYLLWTPIGTYTTRRMIDLNPEAS